MDGELLGNSSSDNENDKGGVTTALKNYTEAFNKVCPHYMAIGMTYEQFWDGDNEMPIHFREANKLKEKKKNYDMWLMGMYVYDVLGDIAPILNSNAKKGTKATPYRDMPIPITEEDLREQEELKEKKRFEEIKRRMENFATSYNAKRTKE